MHRAPQDPSLPRIAVLRLFLVCSVVSSCFLWGCAEPTAQETAPAQTLSSDDLPLERTLPAGTTHLYELALTEAGTPMPLAVEARGVHLEIRVHPGTEHETLWYRWDDSGLPQVLCVEAAGETASISVRSQGETRGSYRVSSRATADASTHCATTRLWARAEELRESGVRDNLARAAEVYDEVAQRADEADDPVLAASARVQRGDALLALGRSRDAVEMLAPGTRQLERLGLLGNSAWGLNLLAIAHGLHGDVQLALSVHQRALTIREAMNDRPRQGVTHDNLGMTLASLGRHQEAMDHHLRAVELFGEISDPREANARSHLADLYSRLGSPREAQHHAEIAGRINRAIGNLDCLAYNLVVQGRSALLLGDRTAAERLFTESLRVNVERADVWAQAGSHLELGALRLDQRRLEQASDHFREALALRIRKDAADGAGAAHLGLGRTALESGEASAALEHFAAALAVPGHRLPEPIWTAAQIGRARALASLGREAPARDALERALERIEGSRTGLRDGNLRARRFETHRDAYELAMRLALDSAVSTSERHREALILSERAHARTLLDQLSAIDVTPRGEALHREESALRQETFYVHTELDRLKRSARDHRERLGELEARALRLERAWSDLQERLLAQNAEYARLRYPFESLTEGWGPTAGRDRRAVLEYFLGKQESYLFVLSRDSSHVFRLDGRERLEAEVERLRRALSAPGRRQSAPLRRSAAVLYERLLAPAEGVLAEVQELVIISDGALHGLPFEALLTEPAAPTAPWAELPFLLRRWAVRHAPSLAVLQELEKRPASADGDDLLVVSPRLDSSDLEFAATEVGAVSRLYRERRRSVRHLALDAPREELLGRLEAPVRRLHIAAHAVSRPGEGRLPGFYERAGADAPRITLEDIYRLNLEAELVVLSACETGLGDRIGGEGFLGLSRAFLHAGARQLVASLWRVEDRSTAELMTAFHAALPEQGTAQALRDAKLSLLESEWSHPSYWASFVLVGDARTKKKLSAAEPSASTSAR